MKKNNFALRLQESLLNEARLVSAQEGVALNQFINVAVAEKLSALRTAEYFQERAARATPPRSLELLKRTGQNQSPDRGDELPPHSD